MSWNEYVLTLREIESYQKKVQQGHVKDRDTYLIGGPEDPGAAYPNKPKRTRSKGSPPLGGAIGEEVEASSFDIKETLESVIWPRGELEPDVARRLKDIVDDFVENLDIHVEDLNEAHISSGVYSITNNSWLAEPVQYEENVDVATARKKSDNIITRINLIDRYIAEENNKKALRSIDSLKNKIRRMRMAGLKSPRREYSPENIAFKILRREGILGKINKMKQKAHDEEMSLNGVSRDQ
jgi:hypothetical protein